MKARTADLLPMTGKGRAIARPDAQARRGSGIFASFASRTRGKISRSAGCQPATQPAASRRYRGAFTLMEIMIVVAIIGLIAAMGLPSIFKALQKEGMRKAMSDVEDVCFSAREQAIISNKPVAVVIYPRDGRFGVEGASGSGDTVVNTHSGKTVVATLPNGIVFYALGIYRRDYTQSDWAKIFFNPDGTSDEAVIVLSEKGGAQTVKLTIEYATGAPTVSSVDK